MATVQPTWTNVAGDRSAVLVTWALTTANADGAPVEWVEFADRCWQVVGATWGGATCAIEGSNDGTNYFALTNAAGGAAATFVAASGGKQTIEVPRFARPNLTTPGTAAVVNVSLLLRRQQPMRT